MARKHDVVVVTPTAARQYYYSKLFFVLDRLVAIDPSGQSCVVSHAATGPTRNVPSEFDDGFFARQIRPVLDAARAGDPTRLPGEIELGTLLHLRGAVRILRNGLARAKNEAGEYESTRGVRGVSPTGSNTGSSHSTPSHRIHTPRGRSSNPAPTAAPRVAGRPANRGRYASRGSDSHASARHSSSSWASARRSNASAHSGSTRIFPCTDPTCRLARRGQEGPRQGDRR